jgi:two-component system, NtrC family, response regulator AtoC
VVRVGSVKSRPVDVRFVAATNRDLEAEVTGGGFRQDLFYRLNGVSIRIPPLRERVDEIESLAQAFIEGACKTTARAPLVLASEALALLKAQPYPGNIRELRSLLERAIAFATDGVLDAATVQLAITAGIAGGEGRATSRAVSPAGLRPEVETLERQRILEALDACHGNQTKAAELLAMPRRTFVSKLSRYGMTRQKKV